MLRNESSHFQTHIKARSNRRLPLAEHMVRLAGLVFGVIEVTGPGIFGKSREARLDIIFVMKFTLLGTRTYVSVASTRERQFIALEVV